MALHTTRETVTGWLSLEFCSDSWSASRSGAAAASRRRSQGAGRQGGAKAVDHLTGVADRAAGEIELASIKPGDAVAMVDLDALKSINDAEGHAAGDQALIDIAGRLAAGVRQVDTVARWGGDEFVVILRGSGRNAAEVLDRLRADIACAFSAGVAIHDRGEPSATLAAADAALLRAKRAGGGQTLLAQGAS